MLGKQIIEKPDLVEIKYSAEQPKFSFDDIVLPEPVREKLENSLAIIKNSAKVFEEWGFCETHKYQKKTVINLYGLPGTGKTMCAHAIASYLNMKILCINYAELVSKYVGDTAKNINDTFDYALKQNAVLFYDEADTVLSKRLSADSGNTNHDNQARAVFLSKLDFYSGVVLFATNLISNYDFAFMRRILAHIEFPMPDLDTRYSIWKKLIPKKFPFQADLLELAKIENLSGSDISNAILNTALSVSRKGAEFAVFDDFKAAADDILNSKSVHLHKMKMSSEFNSKVEEMINRQGA